MFDIGFSELFLIGVVALVVIGPERLPKVAKTLGLLASRLQRYVNDIKADINREIELDELKKLQSQVQDAANTIKQSISETVDTADSEIKSISESVKSETSLINSTEETQPQPQVETLTEKNN